MTRKALFAGLVAVAVLALAAATVTSVFAQQGQGGRGNRGGRGGMMGDMMYLERSWTAVSFQLDCTDEQIGQLRPTYETALSTRAEAIQAAADARDREGFRTAMTECRATLEAALQEVLTDEQWIELQDLMTARMGGMRRGAGGGQ